MSENDFLLRVSEPKSSLISFRLLLALPIIQQSIKAAKILSYEGRQSRIKATYSVSQKGLYFSKICGFYPLISSIASPIFPRIETQDDYFHRNQFALFEQFYTFNLFRMK